MLTFHVRRRTTRSPSTELCAAQDRLTQTPNSAVVKAAILLLSSYPRLSESDIARGYPLVVNRNPRRAMH